MVVAGGRAARRARAARVHREPGVDAAVGGGARRRWLRRRPAPPARPRHRGRGHGRDGLGRLAHRGRAGPHRAARRALPDGKVVVAGLSMGGALTAALAEGHPELAGIVLINAPAAVPAEMAAAVEEMIAGGMEVMDSIGGDIADPDADEASYGETPLRPLLTMIMAGQDVRERLPEITATHAHHHQPAGPRRQPRGLRRPRGADQRAGRATVAREELPRRHPRLRPGRARGHRGRLRPARHRWLRWCSTCPSSRGTSTIWSQPSVRRSSRRTTVQFRRRRRACDGDRAGVAASSRRGSGRARTIDSRPAAGMDLEVSASSSKPPRRSAPDCQAGRIWISRSHAEGRRRR